MGRDTVKITRGDRSIILPDHQDIYEPEIETYFDRYFDAVDEDITDLDFTVPRLTKLHGLEQRVWLPSITEPIADLLDYVTFADLPRGGTAIDAGGYAGLTAMLLALHVGPEGTVITLEPDPVNAECAARNLHTFHNLHGHGPVLIEAALWKSTGTISFSSEGAMGSAISTYITGRGTKHETPTVTLSSIAAHLRGVDYVKIDVEGAEDEVITDREFFQHHHPRISIECHRRNEERIRATLTGYGYHTRVVTQASSLYPMVEAF